jgi:hypothetical protein
LIRWLLPAYVEKTVVRRFRAALVETPEGLHQAIGNPERRAQLKQPEAGQCLGNSPAIPEVMRKRTQHPFVRNLRRVGL